MSFRIEYLLSKALTPKSRNLKRILDENMQGSYRRPDKLTGHTSHNNTFDDLNAIKKYDGMVEEKVVQEGDDDNGGNGTKHGYNNSSDNEGNENIKNGPDTRESLNVATNHNSCPMSLEQILGGGEEKDDDENDSSS
ncbi:6623_t:CDS:2 [Entrophospora sp. SA101]|nr:6623_t:CDS:2 [Entrophospora sp. SA101]